MRHALRNMRPLAAILAFSVTAPAVADLPVYEEIAATNIVLQFEGFSFTGGTTLKENGKPTCNGLEFNRPKWVGSGFLIKDDGTLLTNFHVAQRAQRGVALFDDGGRYDVSFIQAYDAENDLSVMKLLGTKKHKYVALGDSDSVRPLDPVLAVGNPKGMGLNLTEGKISQVQKDKYGKPLIIQHTAPITSGNSGGALYRGKEVIGVNVSILPGTQFNQAVPINYAKMMLGQKNARPVLLEKAFSPEIFKEDRKLIEVYSVSGEISATDKDDKGGSGTATAMLSDLTDYVIHVTTADGADVDVLVRNKEGKLFACGASNEPGEETIVKSVEYGGEVSIEIFNNMEKKVPVKLKIYAIDWKG